MESSGIFLADGEKLSAEQISATHVPHPGIGEYFHRSTLLIGTRGAGKTFLLRHRKIKHHPGAVYINLVECLQSMARESGLGGRSLNYTDTQRAQIQAKTAALVALTVFDRVIKDGSQKARNAPLGLVAPLLPPGVVAKGHADRDSLGELRRRVIAWRIGDWPSTTYQAGFLGDVLLEIRDKAAPNLSLFLDRAEDAPAPSVQLLIQLLDQAFGILTVIAGRPGLAALVPDGLDPTLVPGDHFEIAHIGVHPYGNDWQGFSHAAVGNYLRANGVAIPRDCSLEWSSKLARDSIRTAITLAQYGVPTCGPLHLEARANRVRSLRNHQLATVRAELQPENSDFPALIRSVLRRRQVGVRVRQGPQIGLTITIDYPSGQMSLLNQRTGLQTLLLKALRCEALYLPPGHIWHPFELPEMFEVPPLFAWDERNHEWIS